MVVRSAACRPGTLPSARRRSRGLGKTRVSPFHIIALAKSRHCGILPAGFEPTSSALFACTQSGAGQCCVSLLCNADSKGQDDYLSGVRPLHQGSEHRVFDRPVSLKLAVKTVRRLRLGAVRCTMRGKGVEPLLQPWKGCVLPLDQPRSSGEEPPRKLSQTPNAGVELHGMCYIPLQCSPSPKGELHAS